MDHSAPVLRCRTPRFAHHGLAFSPFFEGRLAVASGANFGLVGNGRVHLLDIGPGGLRIAKHFDTQDCVYDVAWNEQHENHIIAACGDGGLRLFDVALEGLPIRKWHEHSAEIMSVEWSNLQKDTFVTSSWDRTVKVWSVNRQTSVMTTPAHQAQIYNATWSPHNPSIIATCGADGFLNVFDIRTNDPSRPIQSLLVSPHEALSCDWNKYDIQTLAVASKDSAVRIFDLRAATAGGVQTLSGHSLAVRKVQWSPHRREILASSGYDMTARIWDRNRQGPLFVHAQHTEFVMALQWALFDPGVLATGAWDEEIHLLRA